MVFRIVSELPGRLRLRCGARLFTDEEARGVSYALMAADGVRTAEVHAANGSILLTFEPACREAVLAASGNDAAWQGMPAPEAIFTQENLDVLSHNPDALWDMMEKSGVDLEKAQEQFLPAAAYTMRAFFDAVAWDASNEMERLIPDTIHFERNLTCPVCGSSANIAGVGATQNHGNVKRLYCSCCGANWQFERIRCAVCGTEATSDLEYVHMHGDDKHRLHVCKACGSATPTIFGSEVDDFDPDLEAWRCAELMAVYQDQSAQAEGDKDKGGNA